MTKKSFLTVTDQFCGAGGSSLGATAVPDLILMTDRLTFGSYLSGMGMMDAGALEAGFTLAFAVEYDPGNVTISMKIADMHEANLPTGLLLRQDVTTVNPADLPAVHWFHASPVCKEFSNAKSDGEEGTADIQVAQAVAAYIGLHLPPFVTIENVWGYRNSKSWAIIRRKLARCGYAMQVQHVNMADYGVPQTRKRMIVLAARDAHHVTFPHKTHEENQTAVPTLFDIALPRWVSWYEAIEDLIPTLPPAKLAKWQIERLPDEMKTILVAVQGEASSYFDNNTPSPTIVTAHQASKYRAILVNTNMIGDEGDGMSTAQTDRPSFTVTQSANGRLRAVLVDYGNTSRDATQLESDEPSVTVSAWHGRRPSQMPSAVIIDGKLSKGTDGRQLQIHHDDPVGTVTSSHSAYRDTRAAVYGRVVKMTPRALARFQSLPDWYQLSGNSRVDVTGIGNGVPSRFARIMGEHISGLITQGANHER